MQVHYGAIYIPEVLRLPVKFVLDKCDLDADHVASTLAAAFRGAASESEGAGSSGKSTVVVTYELKYEHLMEVIASKLAAAATEDPAFAHDFVFAKVHLKEQLSASPATSSSPASKPAGGPQGIGGLEWPAAEGEGAARKFVWIGEEGLTLTNLMLVHNGGDWSQYDPASQRLMQGVNTTSRTLKRRYVRHPANAPFHSLALSLFG